MRFRPHPALALLAAVPLLSGDLPMDIQAKFVRILANAAGSSGKIACKDSAFLAELAKVGVNADPGSKVAWASSEAEVKAFKGEGKLVICGKLEWLPAGAAIALIEEGGKPQIYLHMAHIGASGVTLTETVLKIGKRV